MQQFVVPQFIDVEDKVIGPITVRQFIILLVGSGLIFAAYKLADFSLFLIEFIVLSGITFGFAFIKVNGRPVHYFILNLIQTTKRPRLRLWQKVFSEAQLRSWLSKKPEAAPLPTVTKNKVRATRLAELALIVDTGGVYQGEKEPPNVKDDLL